MVADQSPRFERIAAERPPLADDAALRRTLGELLISAVPRFYSLVPLADEQLADAVGEMIGKAGGEMEFASAMLANARAEAVVTWLPLSHLPTAQRMGSIELMRHVGREGAGDFLRAIGGYSKSVEPIEGTGTYLSRVAVAEDARGRGLGRLAVGEVIDAASGGDVWLHVAADNEAAIRLYQSMDFELSSSSGFESRAMRRPGQA